MPSPSPSLEFSWYIHAALGECVPRKFTSEIGIFHGVNTKKHCITILYHTIQNTVANTINAAFLCSDWLYFLWY